MATLSELEEREELLKIEVELEAHQMRNRLIYGVPDVIGWLSETLPSLEADFHEGKLSPKEQLFVLLEDFITGQNFDHYAKAHFMNPYNDGIWELKTTDLRLFGWFYQKCVFVVAHIDTAYRCKLHSLYNGYQASCVQRRNNIDLDEPKHITGGYKDVL